MEPSKTYFFTGSILKWKPILFDDKLKQIIIDSLTYLTDEKAIKVYAFVIMPNHIHLILKSLNNPKFKNAQLSFMRFTAQKIKFYLIDNSPLLLNDFVLNKKDRQYQIWQRNPLAIELYSPNVFVQKLDYIHNNPVQGKWMLSSSPLDYEWSSIRFYEIQELKYEFLSHYKNDL